MLDDCTVYDLEKVVTWVSAIKFDVVIMSHVLSTSVIPKATGWYKNILNHKGIVIVVVPNIMHYRSRFELIKGNFWIWKNRCLGLYTLLDGIPFNQWASIWYSGIQTVVNDVRPLPFGRLLNKIPSDNIKNSIRSFLKSISKGLFGSEIIYVFEIEALIKILWLIIC